MSSKGNKAAVRELITEVEARGCTVTYGKSGHWKITTPTGAPVFMASTPSDHRGILRTVSVLRKNGVDLRTPP